MVPSPWRVLAASVAGNGHVRGGIPCQDAHCFNIGPKGELIAAVADGAGSVPLADVGSGIASQAAVAAITEQLCAGIEESEAARRTLLSLGLEAALRAVHNEAASRDCSPDDLSTTLALVVATPKLVAAAHIGDGVIVARLQAGGYLAVTRPQRGEYANETLFLTAHAALESAEWFVQHLELSGLCLLTDGLQQLALRMPAGEPHLPFFDPLLRFVETAADLDRAEQQLTSFLRSERVTERTDDDLTLVLAAWDSSSLRSADAV